MYAHSNPNGEEAHAVGFATDKLVPPSLGGLAASVFYAGPVLPRLISEVI